MSIKFLVLGGGGILGFFWWGSADFIFMGARIFLIFDCIIDVEIYCNCKCNSTSH